MRTRGIQMRNTTLLAAWALSMGFLLMAIPALAHHGGSSLYDMGKSTTVKATVSEFVWANPHCEISFDGMDESGKARHWTDQTFLDTNDLALKYADPDGYPRASIHPMRFKLVQTPDFVYFLYEYNQSYRPVAMNRAHSADPDPTWFGEAVGKWEGDTLVIDAIGFNDRAWLDPIGHPRSESLHLVERWRRVDHDTLVNDLTIDDPVAYTKPWNGQLTFKLDHSGELHESIYTATDELRFKTDILNKQKEDSGGK